MSGINNNTNKGLDYVITEKHSCVSVRGIRCPGFVSFVPSPVFFFLLSQVTRGKRSMGDNDLSN